MKYQYVGYYNRKKVYEVDVDGYLKYHRPDIYYTIGHDFILNDYIIGRVVQLEDGKKKIEALDRPLKFIVIEDKIETMKIIDTYFVVAHLEFGQKHKNIIVPVNNYYYDGSEQGLETVDLQSISAQCLWDIFFTRVKVTTQLFTAEGILNELIEDAERIGAAYSKDGKVVFKCPCD